MYTYVLSPDRLLQYVLREMFQSGFGRKPRNAAKKNCTCTSNCLIQFIIGLVSNWFCKSDAGCCFLLEIYSPI